MKFGHLEGVPQRIGDLLTIFFISEGGLRKGNVHFCKKVDLLVLVGNLKLFTSAVDFYVHGLYGYITCCIFLIDLVR